MNIPVLSKNEEGLEGLVKKQHRKKPGKLEFSRRLLQHNWMRLFYEVRQTNIIMYEYSCGRFRAKKINSALKIAAVRGEVDDLPARCISLLKEVKEVMPPIGEWCRIFDHSSLLIKQPVPLLPLQDLKRLKNPGSFKSKGPELATFSALGPHKLLLSLHVRKIIALQSAQGLDAGKWFFRLRELHLM